MRRNARESTELKRSERLGSLGMLAAGLAHEINTPVGSLHSNNDILWKSVSKIRRLLEGLALSDPRQSRELHKLLDIVDNICRVNEVATERITHVVRNLRDFARLDKDDRKPFDIHEGIENTLALLRHRFRKRIRVVKDYGDAPKIECSPNAVNQVFMNLLLNAAEAIPDRGTIAIRTFAEDGCVKVSITDTGAGIAPENMSKVFDPGFTTKGVGVGSGLGLSICYRIVQAHRGRIGVESVLGSGSTFTVTLPSKYLKESNYDAA